MPPDPIRIAETQAWLRRANRDLRAADHDMKAEPPLHDAVVFHCQQAAEKSMKALLSWHDRPFRKTHSLEEIGSACMSIEPALSVLVARAAPLTEYAWKFRYPGELLEPSAAEAKDALEVAREVYDAISALLPREATESL